MRKPAKKISDSQRERHAKIRAFNEAAKLSAVKRIWEKERFSGFVRFDLLQYSEAYAIYSATDLSNPNKSMTYKVYYYFNDNLQYYDAISMEDATQFCEQFRNPDVQILANESKNKVVVLGLLGEDKTPRKKKR